MTISNYLRLSRSDVAATLRGKSLETYVSVFAVAVLFIISLIFVRPQIEEWPVSYTFIIERAKSPWAVMRYMIEYSYVQFPRVLEVFPMTLGAMIAKGAPIGWGITYGLILIAKYFAAKWALGKRLAPRQIEVISILAVVMVPWEGQWRGHNVPMQTATLFMILGVGAILRCRDEWDLRWAVLTSIFIAMSIASYEALLIIALVLPIMAVLSPGNASWRSTLARTFPLALVPIGLWAGITIYMLMTKGSRWVGVIGFHERPLDNVVDALKLLYSTSLLQSSMTLIALPLYIFLLCENSNRVDRYKLFSLASILLLLLPLAAAPFLSSYPYLKDEERVGIPIGFGFFMLCTLMCLISKVELRRSTAIALISCTVLCATANAFASWRPYGEIQRPVLNQVKDFVAKEPGRRFLVRDGTNRMGDVFTFQHADIFRYALFVLGVRNETVELCLTATPGNRFFPEFVKLEFPVSPVPVCQTPAEDAVLLDVHWVNRQPVVVKVR